MLILRAHVTRSVDPTQRVSDKRIQSKIGHSREQKCFCSSFQNLRSLYESVCCWTIRLVISMSFPTFINMKEIKDSTKGIITMALRLSHFFYLFIEFPKKPTNKLLF